MDWIRRNWPDLLIGFALVAVIGGIIATLITGGSFFPFGPSSRSLISAQPAPSSTETSPRTVVTGEPSPQTGPAAPSGQVQAEAGQESGEQTGTVVAVLPSLTGIGGENPASSQSPSQASTGTPQAAVSSSQNPQAVAASSEGAFRLGVGAFRSAVNAEAQAETFRAAGYPVFIGTQNELSLVLVGPYQSEAEAVSVAARIRASNLGVEPILYRFREDGGASPQVAEAVTPTPRPAVSSGSGSFIQVGAYGSSASAQPQRQRLESLGFAVAERQESGLVKLLIGPFEGESLATARAQLEAQNIDYFVR